jgi:hypothetical protein
MKNHYCLLSEADISNKQRKPTTNKSEKQINQRKNLR